MIPQKQPSSELLQEVLQNVMINQAYMATMMKAQAQILATFETKDFEGIYKAMNQSVQDNYVQLLKAMRESYEK